VPLTPREPKSYKRRIEVTAECSLYDILGYFEQLLAEVEHYFHVEARGVKATTERIQALENEMGYDSGLEILVETTLAELNQCLHEFHSVRSAKGWAYSDAPTIRKTLYTSLAVHTDGVSCLGRQIWYVEAADLRADDDARMPFCIISGAQAPGWADDDVLSLNFWPDWNKGHTPLSYRDYLAELLDEFKHRGIIKRLPGWLTQPEPIEPPTPATGCLTDSARQQVQSQAPPHAADVLPQEAAATKVTEDIGGDVAQRTDWRSRLPTLRADARVRYQKIIEYWEEHPEKTEEQVAREFSVSTSTVQRAMDFRDGKT
jgi:hypothetical protein